MATTAPCALIFWVRPRLALSLFLFIWPICGALFDTSRDGPTFDSTPEPRVGGFGDGFIALTSIPSFPFGSSVLFLT